MVTTTVAARSDARRLAHAIVEERLAACVQFWPIRSVYRWQGKIEDSGEFAVVCKTRASRAPELQRFIRTRHAYELPELVVTPIAGGLPDYLRWVAEGCGPSHPAVAPQRKRASAKGRAS
jgi:periplasmic divalent cation tolerance protein